MERIKVIALFGKSASGKDTIEKFMVSNWSYTCRGIISCTTRPQRDYEKDGVDYYFLTNIEFGEKVLNGEMLEATEFNDWFYGTPISSLAKDKINVGVFNPAGIDALLQDSRLDVLPVYVAASDKTRLLRSLNREQNPNCHEICRRFMVDEKDFDDSAIDFDYIVLMNENEMDKERIANLISDFNHYVQVR